MENYELLKLRNVKYSTVLILSVQEFLAVKVK